MKSPLRLTNVPEFITHVLIAIGLAAPISVLAGGGQNHMAIQAAVAASENTSLPTDRIIIKYRNGVVGAAAAEPASERIKLHRRVQDVAARNGWGMRLVRIGSFNAHVMRLDRVLPHASMQELARNIMAADPSVEYAEPDRIMRAQFTPNDTQYGQQWNYYETTGGINLPAAWEKATGNGVVVAVIDTGYRPHADLVANVLPGYDFIRNTTIASDGNARDNNAQDPGDGVLAGGCGSGQPRQDESSSWHGTHVAGTIAAVSNNGSGVAGVAFKAKVVPVRVLGKCGGYLSDIADGMVWAAGGDVTGIPANAFPARVINLSLGGSGTCDSTSQNAINFARSRGTVVVAAAGNSNADASAFSPASCPGVIAVAATNRNGGRAFYSNYGSVVSVSAPGGDMRSSAANGILSTLNNGTMAPGADSYEYYQGTSMATPHVSGVVALMLSKNPGLTPDEVTTLLKRSARAFPAACSQCGAGIVDANAAVDAAGGGTPPPAPPPPKGNEVEPNNSLAQAQSVTQGTTISGTIASNSDVDYFKVAVPAKASLVTRLAPNSNSDYDLYVYNSSGALIGSSTKGTGQIDTLTVTKGGRGAAVFYIQVRFYAGGTGNTAGAYTLSIN